MPRGAIHQFSTTSRRRPAVPGMVVDVSQDSEHDVLINRNPDADELYTLVIDTATNDQTYGLDLTDPTAVDVTYTADASATLAEIADGMEAAWNASPLARAIAVAASDNVDTVTFTGVYPGVPFTLAEDEGAADMTLTNTTDAAEADPIPFGRAVLSLAYETNEPDQLGILAVATALTAQVDTITVTFEASEIYQVSIEIEGERYAVEVDADTNDDTTAAAIRTAINAIMPANSVIAAGATNVVTLTAEVAGKAFLTGIGMKISPDVNMALVHTTSGVATDLNKALGGISTYSYDTQQLAIDTESAEYAANAGVDVLRRGRIWVENSETIALAADVYVELAAGANAGKFYAASSATRVRVDPSLLSWRREDHGASGAWDASDGGVAALSISLGA